MFQVQDFSLQIFHQQITFTAFGFFDLDYTFLFSVRKLEFQLTKLNVWEQKQVVTLSPEQKN